MRMARVVPAKDGPFVGDPTCQRPHPEDAHRVRHQPSALRYAKDLQKYLGKQQYFHRALGSATGFNVAWPAVRNFSVFNGLQWGYLWKNYWIDETQAPLKKT